MNRWVICSRCNGDGQHSHDLGAFTGSEWEQEDDEFRENYMRGAYDRPCETCEGSGKVRVPNEICNCCGEDMAPGQTFCCSDDFAEAGEMRETGR